MERQRAEQERKRQAEAERQRKMREAYNHAQTFHRDDHYQVWYNGAQMTSTRALTYNEHTTFNLREKFWGFGDATIKGTPTWREGAGSVSALTSYVDARQKDPTASRGFKSVRSTDLCFTSMTANTPSSTCRCAASHAHSRNSASCADEPFSLSW
jgi:hypothetical protein